MNTHEQIDLDTLRILIENRIKEFGSQKNYAEHLGMHPQQLSRSLTKRVVPDGKVLVDLGFEKKTVFCKRITG